MRTGFIMYCMILLFLCMLLVPSQLLSQSENKNGTLSVRKICAIIDGIIKGPVFHFVDQKSGNLCKSTIGIEKEAQLILASPYNDWRYWNGVLNIAMLRLSEVFEEKSYRDFAIKNIAFGFDNYRYFEEKHRGENKWTYPFGQFFIMEELDDCGAIGASVIEVYKHDRQKRYFEYIKKSANHILVKQSRLHDGTFVRSFPYKWTIWADDLYMSVSFLSRMGELTGETKYFDDAARQVINFHKYLFNENVHLMYHCWYSDVRRNGVAFWGRANGWAILAQVDLLDRLPPGYPERDTLLTLFQKHILGIAQYQGPNGLWHQLLDKNDSYYETSCSAIFTYAIARAVNRKYLQPRYASIAFRGWEGIMSRIRDDGQIEGVCTGTVVSDDLVYYYNRPAPINDVHGVGMVLLAGAEVIDLKKNHFKD